MTAIAILLVERKASARSIYRKCRCPKLSEIEEFEKKGYGRIVTTCGRANSRTHVCSRWMRHRGEHHSHLDDGVVFEAWED